MLIIMCGSWSQSLSVEIPVVSITWHMPWRPSAVGFTADQCCSAEVQVDFANLFVEQRWKQTRYSAGFWREVKAGEVIYLMNVLACTKNAGTYMWIFSSQSEKITAFKNGEITSQLSNHGHTISLCNIYVVPFFLSWYLKKSCYIIGVHAWVWLKSPPTVKWSTRSIQWCRTALQRNYPRSTQVWVA